MSQPADSEVPVSCESSRHPAANVRIVTSTRDSKSPPVFQPHRSTFRAGTQHLSLRPAGARQPVPATRGCGSGPSPGEGGTAAGRTGGPLVSLVRGVVVPVRVAGAGRSSRQPLPAPPDIFEPAAGPGPGPHPAREGMEGAGKGRGRGGEDGQAEGEERISCVRARDGLTHRGQACQGAKGSVIWADRLIDRW